MIVFSSNGNTKGSRCHCLLGRVWALWTNWDHLYICCQSMVSPPQLGIPGPMSWVQVGIPNPLAQAVTSLSNHPMPSCLPRTVGESYQPQCSGCPQMLPITLSMMGLGTVLSCWHVPHGMMLLGISAMLIHSPGSSLSMVVWLPSAPQLPTALQLLMTMVDWTT